MKNISTKSIYVAWAIALLATISVVLALTISHWFFVAVIFFVIWYEVFSSKVLRCPNCNKTILMRIADGSSAVVEIKCRSCKQTTKITVKGTFTLFETVKTKK